VGHTTYTVLWIVKVNHNTNHSSLPTYLVTYKTTSCHSERLLNKHTRPSFFKLHSPLYHHHPRNTFTGKNFPVIHLVHSIWSLEHRAASAGNKVRTSVKQPNIWPLAHSLCHGLPFPSLRALRQHTTRLPTWVLSVRMASHATAAFLPVPSDRPQELQWGPRPAPTSAGVPHHHLHKCMLVLPLLRHIHTEIKTWYWTSCEGFIARAQKRPNLGIIFPALLYTWNEGRPNFKVLSQHLPRGTEVTHETISQDSHYPGRDLNPETSEYEAEVSITFGSQLAKRPSVITRGSSAAVPNCRARPRPREGASCLYEEHVYFERNMGSRYNIYIYFGRHFAWLKYITYQSVLVLAPNHKQHLLSPDIVRKMSYSLA
jgi:hypothetical protein